MAPFRQPARLVLRQADTVDSTSSGFALLALPLAAKQLSYVRIYYYLIFNYDNGSVSSTCSSCPSTSRHRRLYSVGLRPPCLTARREATKLRPHILIFTINQKLFQEISFLHLINKFTRNKNPLNICILAGKFVEM